MASSNRFLSLFALMMVAATMNACGVKKDVTAGTGASAEGRDIPELQPPQKPTVGPDVLRIKNEPLKMTLDGQTPLVLNLMSAANIKPESLWLRKSFAFPIQLNGWFLIENLQVNAQDCATDLRTPPTFTLTNDHNERFEITANQRHQMNLEKLYVLKIDLENSGQCKKIDLQFSVTYGGNE